MNPAERALLSRLSRARPLQEIVPWALGASVPARKLANAQPAATIKPLQIVRFKPSLTEVASLTDTLLDSLARPCFARRGDDRIN
jgi:hypothetical protein